MSELPKGWVSSSLSGVIPHNGIISDGDWVESKDQDPEGIVRLIQLADIGDGDFKNKSQRFMTEDAAERLNCSYLKSGDLLIARMPDPLGRACIFPGVGQKAVTVVDVCFIRENELSAISNSLLKYWINSPKIRNLIASNSSGSTRKRITRKNLERFIFPVPPQAEQTRIVEKLDEVLAQVDTIKARLDGIPAILKRFRQSVLAAAVSGRLTAEWRGNSPSKWKEITLSECTTRIGDGLHGTPIYSKDGGFYFVNGNNLSDGKIIIKENTRQVDLIEFDKHRRELNEHTLLLSINGTIGNLALYNGEPIILGKSACYINFNEMIMREFGYILLSSLGFLQYAKQVATGATIQNVPLKGIRNYKFNLPSLEEQKIIIGLVNQYINFANTIEAQVKKTQERVDNLTQSILAKAFRGELVAQDPNDEPAEKLLERIAQARKEAEALAKAAKKVAKTK
mgnify:CR=1 FL=1